MSPAPAARCVVQVSRLGYCFGLLYSACLHAQLTRSMLSAYPRGCCPNIIRTGSKSRQLGGLRLLCWKTALGGTSCSQLMRTVFQSDERVCRTACLWKQQTMARSVCLRGNSGSVPPSNLRCTPV
ncbi:hypothetical protein BJX65DRAFT_34043 [Aspergillus insuetus]